MPSFAVHRGRHDGQLFVNYQAERLSHLKTRFVIPLPDLGSVVDTLEDQNHNVVHALDVLIGAA